VNSRIVTSTTISDAVKKLLHSQIKSGWTSERIAFEMQKAGHAGWSAHTPPSLTRAGTRALSVDEAVALLAVFKSRNRVMEKELNRLTALLSGEGNGSS
jgi:hypothetical protein